MGIEEIKNYTPKQASEILNVKTDTLRRWNDIGKIQCTRLPGGHRRYSQTEIERVLGVGKGLTFNLEEAPLELRSPIEPIAKNILEQDTITKGSEDRVLGEGKGLTFNLEEAPLELRSLIEPIAKNILEQDTITKGSEASARATYAKLRTVRCIVYAVVLLIAFIAVFEVVVEVLI